MKHYTKFNTIEEALECNSLIAPNISIIDDNIIVQSGDIEDGQAIRIKEDEYGNLYMEKESGEPAYINCVYHEWENVYISDVQFSDGEIDPDITYGVTADLLDRNGETDSDEYIVTEDHESFELLPNWESYYDPRITIYAWYEIDGERTITYECEPYVPEVPCIKAGTRVNLADGTFKNIEDITYDDELLVWDFDNGQFASAKPCWITVALHTSFYYKCTLSNGLVLNVIGANGYTHRVYSITDKTFAYINFLIGKQIYVKDANEPVTVVSVEEIHEPCIYYNMDTAYHINWFADNILVGRGLENMYQYDDNMTYIKDGREPKPYSIYEVVGISRYWYDNLRLSETLKTVEYMQTSIDRMERTMKPREN